MDSLTPLLMCACIAHAPGSAGRFLACFNEHLSMPGTWHCFIPMPISRLRLLLQFRMGSHSLPVERGRLARPAIPRHLRRCTFCGTGAPGNERHFVFDCPHFAHVRRQFRSLFDDADGTMQLFFWHTNQKAVCHCLTAILGLADDSNSDMSS